MSDRDAHFFIAAGDSKGNNPLTVSAPEHPAPIGYAALVRRNRNFRYLWFGQIVSLLGDWFNLIASASLIGRLSESGLAIGGLFVVRMLAPFLISPIAGVVADRYNRKRLLIATDFLRAVVVLGFLLVRSPQHIWLLYVLTAVQLAISGVFFPTRNAILPDLVDDSELGAANALSSATWSVMLALGAALGGLVAGGWGIYPAFIIDALTFLLSALLLSRIVYQIPSGRPDSGSIRQGVREYVDGLQYLWNHPHIFAIASQKGAFTLFVAGAFQVLQVTLSEQVFVIGEGGAISLGLIYAVLGVGTGVGPIFARKFTGDREHALRVGLVIAYPMAAVGMAIMWTLGSFELVLLGTLIRAVGGGINWVYSNQLLLQLVPQRVRGRVFSTDFALFTLASAAGAAVGGWALDQPGFDVRDLMLVMAALSLLPAVFWSRWLRAGRPRPDQMG